MWVQLLKLIGAGEALESPNGPKTIGLPLSFRTEKLMTVRIQTC